MGFDLFAHNGNPSDDSGYFRANIWSWPGILDLIAETGVMSEDALISMSFNDGYSVSEEEATLIADRIEASIKGMDNQMSFVPMQLNKVMGEMQSAINGFVEKIGQEGVDIKPERPMYSTQVAHVREFIKFARNSGGFDVC